MGESSKFEKSWTFELQSLFLQYAHQIFTIWSLYGQLSLDRPNINQRTCYNLPNSAFWGRLSMEIQPQNPEFRNNPENFHLCVIWKNNNNKDRGQSKLYVQYVWSIQRH